MKQFNLQTILIVSPQIFISGVFSSYIRSKIKNKFKIPLIYLYAFDLLYHLESVPETTESLWDYKITKLSRLWPLIKLVYFLGKINFMFQQPILEELAKFLPTINGFTFHLSKKNQAYMIYFKNKYFYESYWVIKKHCDLFNPISGGVENIC